MSDDELRKLVNCVQLVDIRTVSVEGRIDTSDGVSEDIDDEGELPLSFETAVAVRDDAQGLMASFTATFDRGSTSSAPATHMKIAVAVFYEFEGWGRENLSQDLLRGFAEKVALYQALPFLREAFITLAGRLRVPAPMLPLMPQSMGPGDLAAD